MSLIVILWPLPVAIVTRKTVKQIKRFVFFVKCVLNEHFSLPYPASNFPVIVVVSVALFCHFNSFDHPLCRGCIVVSKLTSI